jgi:hypothetical protein
MMPPRHKPWIKVDADADQSDKVAGLPSHSARWGWFRTMCRAKTQRRMGVFAGPQHLRQLLGTEGRYVPDLVKAGLLHVWPTDCYRCAADYTADATDGDLVVHDYRREQRDPTNADRQALSRDRNAVSNGESNANVTLDSRGLSPSLSMSPSETIPREPYQVADDGTEYPVLAWLSQQGVTIQPNGNGFHRRIVILVERFGAEPVRTAMAGAMAAGAKGDRAIVFGAENLLDRIPSAPPTSKPKGLGPDMDEVDRAFSA